MVVKSGIWLLLGVFALEMPATVVERVEVSASNPFYTGNRAPLQPSPFVKLPLGSITPQGWLRRQLELDASGMCGNLPKVSEFVKPGCAWASPAGEGHHGWEEPVYWLRGYGDLGYVLNDRAIIAETRVWIEAMIASRQPDGYFGPKELRTREKGKPECWPHFLAVNALRSYYEFTGDARVIDLLTGYFKWVAALQNDDFRRSGLDNIRAVEQLANVYWLYNRTGDTQLLELARRIHANTANWLERRPTGHNVDFAMSFREPAEYWQLSGEAKHRAATRARYDEVMAEFGQFPGGGFAGDENISGAIDPRQGLETCGFAEFMHSFQILTRIEGEPLWADRCEEIAFNSFPAALTPDHKGLHYVTCANMVSNDFRNRRNTFCNGWVKTGYSPTADYRCCQHNYGIGWSFYAEELWLATADRGLCASLYAASSVKAKVGDGTEVEISEETDYPFSETITFKLAMAKSVKFPLYLRLPKWCENPTATINNKAVTGEVKPLSYLVLNRLWKNGDTVTLTLPMRIQTRTWKKNKDSMSVCYGPLWFSLKIGEEWKQVDRGIPGWPGWEVWPTTPWNYGLVSDGQPPEKAFTLIRKKGPVSAEPFTHETVPVELQAKARRIPEWTLGSEKWIEPLQMSPAFTKEPVETVTLIPMAAARLRICSFPTVSSEASATPWSAFKAPLAAAFKPSSSFVCDQLEAVNDGAEPSHSADGSLARLTWWNHQGTPEWVQYTFDKPRAVSAVSVYWFDDASRKGGCRVPASWTLKYLKEGQWHPVVLDNGQWKALEGEQHYGVKRDEYNTVRFQKVTAEALRLEVQLQEKASGGVLEWKVSE
jgi:hypothetical protein